MQTQFWKKLKEEIYFIFLGKIVGIIIIIFTIITIVLSSHFLSIWHNLFYLMPAIIVMVINCLIFIALYQYSQIVQSGIQSRQTMIKTTFETIHNGPLQTLAKVLRLVKRKDLPIHNLLPLIEQELEELNQELRGMYELWQQETLTQDTSLYLGNNVVIDLRNPLPEILYQVYNYTLERDFPCFKTLKLKIHSFEPIYESSLSIENKRGLCRFLEEALCNVGKHATDITCLQVTYSWVEDQGIYTLSIIDNGLGIYPLKEGWGTKQFKNLAQQINGKFRRVSLYPQGTLCELSWPLPNSFWWQ
ncbi:sensor histidine kinase [Dolichospermum sp. UHCC 0259]|uniref:sensor histidine kinase n=1 Tax=Dolichospermum sp. UHCC 0259 TaxID=2590010 RepID=UPI001445F91C|nr:sensor histidine kinase [Dolichospermum sp. UHCC 0259]MTJ49585.1 sensor histidine kinase [Dolichospermum sp. UHCC 0259]